VQIKQDLGVITLACAAVDDVLAWCTLAVASSYASSGSGVEGLYVALSAIGFVLIMCFPVHKGSDWLAEKYTSEASVQKKRKSKHIMKGFDAGELLSQQNLTLGRCR
jgi:Kef-type K+ transport system membrane component KefB